jgi:hypothetical protein
MLPQRVERELAEGEAWDCYSNQVEFEAPVKDIWENRSQNQGKKHRLLIIGLIIKIISTFTKRIFDRNPISL